MTMGMGRKKYEVESTDEGLVLLPFNFEVVSDAPDASTLTGDCFTDVDDSGQGKYTLHLREKPVAVCCGFAGQGETADNVDLYGQVDWSAATTTGLVVVKFKTAGTNTDVATTKYVGGFLLVKKTNRRANRG